MFLRDLDNSYVEDMNHDVGAEPEEDEEEEEEEEDEEEENDDSNTDDSQWRTISRTWVQ